MTFKVKNKKVKEKKSFAVKKSVIPNPPKNAQFEIKEVKKVSVPHPYGITPKHILPNRMYLNKETIKEAESQGAECFICKGRVKAGVQDRIYTSEEHNEQKTLFLQMKTPEKDLNKVEGLNKYLMKIKPILKKKRIDGVAFIPKK